MWMDEGQGFEFEGEEWEDEQRLVLGFYVNHGESDPILADDEIRCLACLGTREHSILEDGD